MKKSYIYAGASILALMIISFFVKIRVESTQNYEIIDSLLGIIIFHNMFVFGFYIIIALSLIIYGIRKKVHKF